MEDSIVQQLRDRAYAFKATDRLSERAADEIERLQAALAARECEVLKKSLLELINNWDGLKLLQGMK